MDCHVPGLGVSCPGICVPVKGKEEGREDVFIASFLPFFLCILTFMFLKGQQQPFRLFTIY